MLELIGTTCLKLAEQDLEREKQWNASDVIRHPVAEHDFHFKQTLASELFLRCMAMLYGSEVPPNVDAIRHCVGMAWSAASIFVEETNKHHPPMPNNEPREYAMEP